MTNGLGFGLFVIEGSRMPLEIECGLTAELG